MTEAPTVYTPVETGQSITISLSPSEHYELLIQRLLEIRSQRATNAHRELVLAKYEAGQAIARSPLYEGHIVPGSGRLLRQVGRDLNWSQSEMYSCLKFWHEVESHGSLKSFIEPFGAAVSWTKIKHQMNKGLPRPKTPKQDLVKLTQKSDRIKAVRFSSERVGKVWTVEDQARLERLLNMVQTKRENTA